MADFIAEFTIKEDEDKGPTPWIIWIDDLSNQCAGGVRVVLRSLEGDLIECAIRLQFLTTNNEV